jgi:choline dehydrogenase-like flavoprotein
VLQVIRSPKIYDVCIIGSGAAGGAAAKVLTEGGVSVVMLEAGPPLDPAKDFKEHLWPYDLPHRGGGVGGKLRGEEADEFMAPNGAWEIDGEPYVLAPGSTFRWFRSRIVGGRSNHWGRVALRFSPMDFRPRSRDGMGDDCPAPCGIRRLLGCASAASITPIAPTSGMCAASGRTSNPNSRRFCSEASIVFASTANPGQGRVS